VAVSFLISYYSAQHRQIQALPGLRLAEPIKDADLRRRPQLIHERNEQLANRIS